MKRKMTAAQRQLQTEWENILKKHSKPLERGFRMRGQTPLGSLNKAAVSSRSAPSIGVAASNERTHALFEGMRGSTAKVEKKYTGTAIVGIAAMHKSNLVPVFSEEAAKDVATMRRN